jgi:hypothetical protein
MKEFKFEILPSGYINCLEADCMLSRECANHTTAGDFRTDDGGTPIIKIVGKQILCKRAFSRRHSGSVKLGIVLCPKF